MSPPTSNIQIAKGLIIQEDGTEVATSPSTFDFLPSNVSVDVSGKIVTIDPSPLSWHRGFNAYRQRGTSPFSSWYALGGMMHTGLGAIAAPNIVGGNAKLYAFIAVKTGTIDKVFAGSKTGTSGGGCLCTVVCYKATSQTNLYPDTLAFESDQFDWTFPPEKPSVYEVPASGTLVGGNVYLMGIRGYTGVSVGIRGYSARYLPPILGAGVSGVPITTSVYLNVALSPNEAAPLTAPDGGTIGEAQTGIPNLFYHYAS